MTEVINNLKDIIQAFDNLAEIKNQHPDKMQKVEYEISDILHLIENSDIPSECCETIIGKLKELRQERRSLKNQYELMKTYETYKDRLLNDNSRIMFASEIGKAVNKLDSEYKNRVLTKEEIEELITPKKKKVGRPKKEDKECEV